MKVLIIEPYSSGHHMSLYLRNIFKFFRQKKWGITIITSDKSVKSAVFKKIMKENLSNIQIETIEHIDKPYFFVNFITIFFHQVRWWLSLRKTFKSLSKNNTFDCVYIPSIDFVIHPLALFRSPFGDTPFYGNLISSKNHLKQTSESMKYKNRLKKNIYTFLIKRLLSATYLKKLFIIEENIYKELQHRSFIHYEKIEYLPDFSDIQNNLSKKESRKTLGLRESDFVILVYGSLSIRKGAINLLKSIVNYNNSKHIKILVAGTPDKEFLNEFNKLVESNYSLSDIVIQRLYYHDEYDQDIVFKASDCLWLGYTEGFMGSSGVLYISISYNIPIIGTYDGVIGDFLEKYNFGVACNPDDLKNIFKALTNIQNKINEDEFIKMSKQLVNLSKRHSVKEHMNRLIKFIGTSIH